MNVWARRGATASVLVACLLVGGLVMLAAWSLRYPDLDAVPDPDAGRVGALLVADVFFGLVAIALLPLVIGRRARPGTRAGVAALVILACTALSALATPAYLVALTAVASWRRPRWLAAACGVAGAAVAVALVVDPVPGDDPGLLAAAALPVIGLPVLGGLYLGSRRALLASLRDQVYTGRREQAALVEQARANERLRVARELHDTVSHRLSLVSLHAGGLAVHPDLPADKVEQTARLIQQTARSASEELHALLTLLREDPREPRPDPTLADLDAVCDARRAEGVEVTTDVPDDLRGRLGEVGRPQSRALLLVIGEGVANAVKHAPGRPVAVALRGAPESGVEAVVRNPMGEARDGLAGGFGLVGLTERVTLAGGRLSAGREGDEFVLRGWVPWT